MNGNDVDDGTVGGYYTSIADMRQVYAEGKPSLTKINIFAVRRISLQPLHFSHLY